MKSRSRTSQIEQEKEESVFVKKSKRKFEQYKKTVWADIFGINSKTISFNLIDLENIRSIETYAYYIAKWRLFHLSRLIFIYLFNQNWQTWDNVAQIENKAKENFLYRRGK